MIAELYLSMPAYIAQRETARIMDARDTNSELIAFDIADFGSRDYAFYMFNFRSRKHKIPGVSDLLLPWIVKQAQEGGKHYLNLGLGINPGVAFFKRKWGAEPFLKHNLLLQKILSNLLGWMRLTSYPVKGSLPILTGQSGNLDCAISDYILFLLWELALFDLGNTFNVVHCPDNTDRDFDIFYCKGT